MQPGSQIHPDRQASAGQPDHAAFASAYARFAPGIRRFFEKRSRGRRGLAEELAQQTWSEVWQLIHNGRYDPDRAALSTLAYAVAQHVWLRHTHARPAATGPLPQHEARASDPASAIAHAELLDALRDCLNAIAGETALDAVDRQIVTGIARGRTERELAGELGLAPSSINARKQIAYARLRRCLAAKGFSYRTVEQIDLYLE